MDWPISRAGQLVIDFVSRSVPLGDSELMPFEAAVVPHTGQTLVVLREARRHPLRTPVLTACFEHIASVLRIELVLLRQLPQPLRFFHCRYEHAETGRVCWALREVCMRYREERYSFAHWQVPDEAVLERLNASLNLSESPERLL